MTRINKATAIASVALLSASTAIRATPILIEGEAFQFKGKWVVEKSSDCLGSAMLRVYQDNRDTPADDALTVVNIQEAGKYKVWTRSQDFANSTRPRTYTLTVDGKQMSPSGAHGVAGFRWEAVGEVTLDRKPVMLRLSDTGHYFGRCDAIFLTEDLTADPNTMTNAEIARWRRNPVTMDYTTDNAPALASPADITPGYTVLASASNDDIRISFVRLLGDGSIVCKTDYHTGGSWRRFVSSAEDNRLALISCDRLPAVNHNGFYPAWDYCTASRTLTFEGNTYPVTIDGDDSNPFFTGNLTEPRATAVTKTAGNCIKVTYDCGSAGNLIGYWTVADNGPHIAVKLLFKPSADGYYSVALHGAKGVADHPGASGVMPPMFAGKRLPDTPLTLFSSMMTQPLAAVTTPDGGATAFVAADLDTFPDDWGGYDNSPVGFTLRNSLGELQPVAFSPLSGMAASKVKGGRPVEARFIVGITPGDWGNALTYVSDNVFGVTDYRKPSGSSITDIIANITNLIKDDTYSGWEPRLKGFWDIEADGTISPTVVHAAPLAILGAATLAYDEDMYERRALPTIEYLLSRNGYRTRANEPKPLNPTASQFPTTLFEGINTLTGGLNPWLSQLALNDGETRQANGYFSTLQAFRQELSAYRLTAEDERLDRARSLADAYVAEILSDQLPAMSHGSFYNSQMCPDWTPLLDIYRLTGEERYLEAAIHGAAHTLAGVKSWPKVAERTQTIHPSDSYDGVTTIWWKGPEQWRLGFPRRPGDAPQHDVEAWSVSPVGLGIEQPATYFLRSAGKTVRPVFMNSWAPRLLELAHLSGQQIFETYARNAVIGRSENYPGYYATGYTDIPSSPLFPYQGPDVSSIYFHHIPAHLAMLQDYLIGGIIARSDGAVDFPAARQEGFVWFANNIYGTRRGTVNGEEAELYLPAGGISTGNPAVSHIAARNASRLFIILSNDGDTEADITLSLSPDIASRLANPEAEITAKVAPRGIKILTLDADFHDLLQVAPQTEPMEVIATGTEAGEIYLFRIRSPFGWDSLYGFAGCAEVDGLSIIAEHDGSSVTATGWPYEWSFTRIPCGNQADVKITILKNGKEIKSISHTFTGDHSGVESVRADISGPRAEGIFTIDGRRIDRISSPGVYIVDGEKVISR